METDRTGASPTKGAAEAFEDLRREVEAMRRVVEAAIDPQRGPPDYSETLGQIAADLAKTTGEVVELAGHAALSLTPKQMAEQITAAGRDARAADRRLITDAVAALSGWTEQARTADHQNRRLLQVGSIVGVAGLIFGLLLPPAALRAAPEAWDWPERGAAWVLGLERWPAGERMMASADPERWREVQMFRAIGQENREAIQRCRDKVERMKRGQSCAIGMAADALP